MKLPGLREYIVCIRIIDFGIILVRFLETAVTYVQKMASIPQLEYTNKDAIPEIVNGVRATFHSQKTKPLEWRKVQLRKLYWG